MVTWGTLKLHDNFLLAAGNIVINCHHQGSQKQIFLPFARERAGSTTFLNTFQLFPSHCLFSLAFKHGLYCRWGSWTSGASLHSRCRKSPVAALLRAKKLKGKAWNIGLYFPSCPRAQSSCMKQPFRSLKTLNWTPVTGGRSCLQFNIGWFRFREKYMFLARAHAVAALSTTQFPSR